MEDQVDLAVYRDEAVVLEGHLTDHIELGLTFETTIGDEALASACDAFDRLAAAFPVHSSVNARASERFPRLGRLWRSIRDR